MLGSDSFCSRSLDLDIDFDSVVQETNIGASDSVPDNGPVSSVNASETHSNIDLVTEGQVCMLNAVLPLSSHISTDRSLIDNPQQHNLITPEYS